MQTDRFVGWAGISGIVGGALWSIGNAVHAARPVGCVPPCGGRPARPSGPLEDLTMSVGFVLIVIAGLAVLLLARRAAASRRLLRLATVSGAVGAGLVGTGLVLNILVYDNTFRLMPAFVWPGLALVVAAVVILALAARQAGVLPTWLVGVVMVSALLLAASNEQTRLAWLSLPFGLAWMAVGHQLRQRVTPPSRA